MNTFLTLYKTDSNGKVREWEVWVEDHLDYATIYVRHGEQGGKKQTKTTDIYSGKNIGKANETTYLEQAYSEAESKWNKQQDKGYIKSVSFLTSEKKFRPMLAKNFKEHFKKVVYPCYVQPKLDGLRCVISWDRFINYPIAHSRKGKEWKCVDLILKSVLEFLEKNKHIILDGEIYTNEMGFQTICSAVKRDEPNELTNLAEFHCYDLYDNNNPELSFEDRLKLIPDLQGKFKQVETILAYDKESIDKHHKIFIERGYEGTIIRNIAGKYKVDGRSHDLLKYKDFMDSEYEIVDKKLDKNEECVFVCLDRNLDKTFDCKPRGSHEERIEYFEEDNIGKMLTVRYFELTDEGLPRFPVGITVRDYE